MPEYCFSLTQTLREKCPYSLIFSGPYFPTFGLNSDQKNSEYGRFSDSDIFPYNNRVVDFVLIQENTCRRKLVF